MILNYKKDCLRIATAMRKGKIAIFPTDTIYGIGTVWNSHNNTEIFMLKRRKRNKPLIMLSDIRWIDKFADLQIRTKQYWPGPFTLIMNAKRLLPWWVSLNNAVAIRVPKNRDIIRLIRAVGAPITATSVNVSGEIPLENIKKIKRIYENRVDIIAEDINFHSKRPSKIIDIRKNSTERRLR